MCWMEIFWNQEEKTFIELSGNHEGMSKGRLGE